MSDFAEARRAMVNSQVRVNDVTDYRIQDAMLELPREKFVPRSQQAKAYGDAEVEFAEGRWLLRPRDLAKLIQTAEIKPGDLVLDVACGRGYTTALIARLAETVVGIDADEDLVTRASERLTDVRADNAVVVKADPVKGVPDQGPFDVIVIAGGVDAVPDALLDQLAEGGRLVAFVRSGPVGRATVFSRGQGGAIGERIVFDGSPTLVPGFEREDDFVF